MTSRKHFIASGAALLGTSLLPACAPAGPDKNYAAAVSRIWRPLDAAATPPGDRNALRQPASLSELVRCATLAPSSHNTQCWKFVVASKMVAIRPDVTRRCPAVDPDDHHLFVSLGCAAENLAQAALAQGLMAQARFESVGGEQITVALEATQPLASPLYQAIPLRQCTRADFDGQPLNAAELRLLAKAGTGNGVQVMMLTARTAMEKVLELVTQGNTAQLNDAAFTAELISWIRFNAADAVASGDGLYSGLSGNPSVPTWLGKRLFKLFLKPDGDNDKYAAQVRSSAGLAVFVSDANDKAHWVETGRCYQRFALQAAALGIRNAMLNQPVEVPALRHQLASFIGTPTLRPDLVVRFGRGALLQRSLRRPVRDVMV